MLPSNHCISASSSSIASFDFLADRVYLQTKSSPFGVVAAECMRLHVRSHTSPAITCCIQDVKEVQMKDVRSEDPFILGMGLVHCTQLYLVQLALEAWSPLLKAISKRDQYMRVHIAQLHRENASSDV